MDRLRILLRIRLVCSTQEPPAEAMYGIWTSDLESESRIFNSISSSVNSGFFGRAIHRSHNTEITNNK